MIYIDQVDLKVKFQDWGVWRSYNLTSEGNTLAELIANAYISELNEDFDPRDIYDLCDASQEVYESALKVMIQEYEASKIAARALEEK